MFQIVRGPSLNFLSDCLLRLPRELRNEIYSHILGNYGVFCLGEDLIQQDITNSTIYQELLEIFFSITTCLITHTNLAVLRNKLSKAENGDVQPVPSSIWGCYSAYKSHIRFLEVDALEVEYGKTELLQLERECNTSHPDVRAEWAELLDLPRLQSVYVSFYKSSPMQFHWASFSPILYELRAKLPRLRIAFSVSFDLMLQKVWNDNAVDDGIHYYPPYKYSGLAKVTELVEPPNDEDRRYVERYLQRKLEIMGRNAIDGLLAVESGERQAFIPRYVVKEPALARVLMEEHYEVYKVARSIQMI